MQDYTINTDLSNSIPSISKNTCVDKEDAGHNASLGLDDLAISDKEQRISAY